MQSLRLSLPRQLILLAAGLSLFSFTMTGVVHHFIFYQNFLAPIEGFEFLPGEDIISPLVYSLHLASGLVGGMVSMWLAWSSRRRSVHGLHWRAAFFATLPFAGILVMTREVGYSSSYTWGLVGLLLGALLAPLFLALVLGYLPLASRRKREARRSPAKPDPRHPMATRFPRKTTRLLWGLAAVLLIGWLAGSLYLEHGWDREEGFGSDVRHLAGVNLPMLPAAAALLVVLTVEMSLRAQRILYVFVVVLQIVAFVPSVVLAVKAVPDLWESLIVIPLALLLHVFWLWVNLRLLEPLYGLDLSWLHVRATVDE